MAHILLIIFFVIIESFIFTFLFNGKKKILLLISLLLLSFFTSLILSDITSYLNIEQILILSILITTFNYLTIEDLIYQRISSYPILIAIVFSLISIVFKIFPITSIGNSLGVHVLGSLISGLFVFLLFKITKQKGIGEGDIYIAILIGLIFGMTKYLIIFFYATTISSAFIGVLYALRKKQFYNLPIPLVPFITFAFYFTILFSDKVTVLLQYIL